VFWSSRRWSHQRALRRMDLDHAPWDVIQFQQLLMGQHMTFVVTEDCLKCKAHGLRRRLPVSCFLRGREMLVIAPGGVQSTAASANPNARWTPPAGTATPRRRNGWSSTRSSHQVAEDHQGQGPTGGCRQYRRLGDKFDLYFSPLRRMRLDTKNQLSLWTVRLWIGAGNLAAGTRRRRVGRTRGPGGRT